jgi:hypothetical protein
MQNATQLLPTKTAGREEKTEIQTLSCKAAAKKETHPPPFPPTPTGQNEEHYHKKEKKTWLPRGEVNEPKPHATRLWEPPTNIHRETDDADPQTKIAQRRKTTRMQRKNEGSKRGREVHSASCVA